MNGAQKEAKGSAGARDRQRQRREARVHCCSEGGGERQGQTVWAKRSEGSEPSDGKMESERRRTSSEPRGQCETASAHERRRRGSGSERRSKSDARNKRARLAAAISKGNQGHDLLSPPAIA